MRNQNKKGITLIALVITVIVLLILAGVAITLALDGGGLFAHANNAAIKWNTAVATEEQKINEVWNILNGMTVENGGGENPTTPTEPTEPNTPEEPSLPASWNEDAIAEVVTETVQVGEDTVERTAPIPTGFKKSIYDGETTIANGLVIYETTTDLAQDTGSSTTNHDSAMTTYNQYVWIPVDDINSMIMCKSSNKVNGTDGTQKCSIVYDETNDVIKCTNHNSDDICGRLYTVTSGTNQTVEVNGSNKTAYVRTQNFDETTQTWNTSNYHEPDTVTGNSDGSGSEYDASSNGVTGIKNILNNTTASSYSEIQTAWENELTNNFTYMAKSVAKYGGFYISRYEIGGTANDNGATSVTSKKGQTVLNAGTYSASGSPANLGGVNRWYGLYKACRDVTTSNNTTTYNRIMIWDSQYDQVMKFIEEGKGSSEEKVTQIGHPNNFRSITWSNYYNSSTYSVAKYPTSTELGDPAMKNVYDLENNYYEWTASAFSTYNRATRGGNFFYAASNGNFYPAASRGGLQSDATNNRAVSARSTLVVRL